MSIVFQLNDEKDKLKIEYMALVLQGLEMYTGRDEYYGLSGFLKSGQLEGIDFCLYVL